MIIQTPLDFHFISAVCSHGFFVLAPNNWNPDARTLNTVITLDEEAAVPVAISSTPSGRLSVRSPFEVSPGDRTTIRSAVRRMLRVDEDLTGFYRQCLNSASHRKAAEMHFGRLLRGASLFEDMVKVICTCNVTWRQTVLMVERLVENWGVSAGDDVHRGFPTPERLARVSLSALRNLARLGYRAEFIHHLARDVVDGKLDLTAIERHTDSSEDLYKKLRQIRGVGDYAAGHLCMLLGHYDRLAVDTEMIRFFKNRHPHRRFTTKSIQAYYKHWHPFQFLAYWFELWCEYVDRHGQAEQWSPKGIGRTITAKRMLTS